jgi:hypothetical protein
VETETLNQLLMAIVAGLIIPIVNGLRATSITNYVRPEFLVGLLALAAAWGLTAWLAPSTPPEEWIVLGLAATGATNIIHGGVKLRRKKENIQ